MPIHILPDEVASQIAAGEVVERPASVVKELVENALDAGAAQIHIHIEGAGKRKIEVADDGSGIAPAELPLAVARHATSKLRTAEDLFRIHTLGFRGEALASIASVSRLTLTSRRQEDAAGSALLVEEGQIRRQENVGSPVGTVVRVEDLFFNVPARLKFLKQDSTERKAIDELVTRYALAYPAVRWHLYQDNRIVLQTSGNGDRREILSNLYGVDTARQMLEVILREGHISLSGYTSPVGLSRSNRKEINFFVNGRWVQDPSLSGAVTRAYQTFLMVGRFPMTILFIDLDPEEVDVNVHPAKAEVRFRKPDEIFGIVQRAVRRALQVYNPAPHFFTSTWRNQELINPDLESPPSPPPWEEADSPLPADVETPPENSPQLEQTLLDSHPVPLLRLVGQIGATYLVAEGPDGLYLIDQHAAHERVLYEKFKRLPPGRVLSQPLLHPVILELPPPQVSLFTDQVTILNRLGFEIEPFGANTFRIRAIPAVVVGADPAEIVRSAVESFEEDETPLANLDEERLIARICKRSAVKAGKILSDQEQQALLDDLQACQFPRTCPHGRPTMIHLSVDLLERQFGRRGSV